MSEDSLEEAARRWAVLDSYHIPTRYPNSLPGSIPARVFTADAAHSALALTREVVAWVKGFLTG
jgi:HEPN domain-containing protein